VRFDCFIVDVALCRLIRDGQAVPLNSKTFDLLLALIESRGELVTSERPTTNFADHHRQRIDAR